MAELATEDFAAFFGEVHERDGERPTPFPWQERLLRSIVQERRWPALLDLPTGTGKTAAIDIALFHLALEADRLRERRAPLRIVYLVDRRTVVTQAAQRARKIAERLKAAEGGSGVLARVAQRLRGLVQEGDLVQVAELRGGIAKEEAWARSPAAPAVLVSTVDQVGSRLLLRGYGVSDSMRPIHAGLLGEDALLLLDEVHLSRPLCQTLEALEGYRGLAERPLRSRWSFVRMSATPEGNTERRFTLREEDRAHPVLRRRLQAKKPVQPLQEVKVSGGEAARQRTFAQALAAAALPQCTAGRRVAVVVNRVDTARAVALSAREQLGDRGEVVLLTGRMRPLEREERERALTEKVAAGAKVEPEGRPYLLVATQCIEAGADFDFDALVTECASLDALRQRFGRLNRLGDRRECVGVILRRSDAEVDDPVYGAALLATWTHLAERQKAGPLDFGLEAQEAETPEVLSELVAKKADAPVLLPAHLEAWSQTKPAPEVEPDVALWLHGPQRGRGEVQVLWRADVTEELLAAAQEGMEALERLRALLELSPPRSAEALSLPLAAVARWLRGQRDAATFADVEGQQQEEEEARGAERDRSRLALRWRGSDDEKTEVVGAEMLAPGDTLVLPSGAGGLRDGNWAPEEAAPAARRGPPPCPRSSDGNWATEEAAQVSDLGDWANLKRGRVVLRLGAEGVRSALAGAGLEDSKQRALLAMLAAALAAEDEEETPEERCQGWLEAVHAALQGCKDGGGWLGQVVTALQRRRLVLVRGEGEAAEVLGLLGRGKGGKDDAFEEVSSEVRKTGGRAARGAGKDDAFEEVSSESDAAWRTGVAVPLREHLLGVEAYARRFAQQCGLPEELTEAVALAGRWHDVGKADPRFQVLLHGGSALRAELSPEPLAKSAEGMGDRAAQRRAAQRAGYPKGTRHELVSVALLQGSALLAQARQRGLDDDLVLHLVASHHGYCRPLAPVEEEGPPVVVGYQESEVRLAARSDHGLARVGSGVCARFWRLQRRYGVHGLCYLEALLRLADHRRSEAEQRDGRMR